jgi:hypothetical protein
MQFAFQITEDDTAHVLTQAGRQIELTAGGHWALDGSAELFLAYQAYVAGQVDRISRAALDAGIDLDGQTERAYVEIAEVLREAGLLASSILAEMGKP